MRIEEKCSKFCWSRSKISKKVGGKVTNNKGSTSFPLFFLELRQVGIKAS
ncbi:MAG: hypothetical protein QXU18_02975 [Thermoplasmatales archaeon]